MRSTLIILAAVLLGCGTLQPTVVPEVLTNVPSWPYKYQKRPGIDGRCSRNPLFFALNGGCWIRVDIPLDECHFDETAETSSPIHIYKGACIAPMLDTDWREPTSRAEPPAPEVPTRIPSKPWPTQKRPGPDGKCDRHLVVLNGGCWAPVVVELEDCREAEASGESYLIVYQGECLYPLFLAPPGREPTSRAQPPQQRGLGPAQVDAASPSALSR